MLLQSEVPPVAEKFAVEGSLRESGMLLMQHGATQLITAVRMMRDLILKSLRLRKNCSGNVNGILSDVDELHLFEIEPETIPEHTHNLFAKFNPAGKRKRRDLTFQQKLALLKWMDFAYPNCKYNFSDISRKISLDRKPVRQMVSDRDFIQEKVDEITDGVPKSLVELQTPNVSEFLARDFQEWMKNLFSFLKRNLRITSLIRV